MLLFCFIYYACSYMQIIPQIIKLYHTKSSNDYSLGQIIFQLAGTICWTIFIFTSVQKTLVYIGSAIDMILLAFVDCLIFKYYKYPKKNNK